MVLIGLAVLLFVTPVRRLLLIRPFMGLMKKAMPSISETEQAAIDAGTVWWEKSLFRGKPDWQALSAVQPAQLSEEEQLFLDNQVETLCVMIDDWQVYQDGDLSQEVWDYMKKEKFFGMGITKAYGGLEFSPTMHSEVIQKISSRSVVGAVTVMVPNSLGPAELLLNYGTDIQKEQYLSKLAVGEEVPCFALTAPDAGSDAGAMVDAGVVEKGEFNGEQVLGIRLNWNKRYITLAPVATLIGLAFKLYDPKHLLGEKENIGITVALIPRDTQGITIGQRHNPLYTPFQNGPTQGKDVFIPMDFVVGGQGYVGQGWRMLMESLAAGRAISLPALSCGTGKMACAVTTAYAKVREQFGISIGRFEGVSERVASIILSTYTVNAVRRLTVRAVDLGEKPSVLSAVAKYNTTETMRKAVNNAMDVVGGKGIIVGKKNILAHVYMAIPVGITVEGANILTRSMITFGQGAIRCNPYVLQEVKALQEGDVVLFDRALLGHIGNLAMGKLRALRFAWFSIIPSATPQSSLQTSYHAINRLSAIFSYIADMSMVVLGGKLKFSESLSGRLADALSGLYQASAVLKWYADQGEPDVERVLAQAAVEQEMYRTEQALMAALRNYPMAWLGKAWLWMLFPWGGKHHPVSDKVLHSLTREVMQNGELRQTLKQGVFVPQGDDQALAQLEQALAQTLLCESLVKTLKDKYGRASVKVGAIADTLKQALKDNVITSAEHEQLQTWLTLRSQVIAVDDFAPEEVRA
jgi:acyl-CoA dehydrogenase